MATPEEMAATMRANIPEKTGKTQSQWKDIIHSSDMQKHGQIVKLLKTEYAVTHGFANLIAHDYLDETTKDKADQDLVATQYAGPKNGLKPIYDALITKISTFGDVEVSPKKAYVSLRHNNQFAIIQPSTKSRIDIGIKLKGEPETERLEKSGSFNAMVSHRVRVSDAKDIDEELLGWLKQAFINS